MHAAVPLRHMSLPCPEHLAEGQSTRVTWLFVRSVKECSVQNLQLQAGGNTVPVFSDYVENRVAPLSHRRGPDAAGVGHFLPEWLRVRRHTRLADSKWLTYDGIWKSSAHMPAQPHAVYLRLVAAAVLVTAKA